MASLRGLRRRAHDGKRPLSRWVARGLAERSGGSLQAYPCPWCGAWHVGHPVRRPHRKRAEDVRASSHAGRAGREDGDVRHETQERGRGEQRA
jgi:hypothetical protein